MSSPIGRRIVVIGPSGSGKSTLAEQLAALIDVPYVELDALNWLPGWVSVSDEEMIARVTATTAGDGWVVAGNYRPTIPVTWPRADTVIWLDLPLPFVVRRILMRAWRRSRSKELLWGTNVERFWAHFKLWDRRQSLVAWVVTTHWQKRREYRERMRDPRWAHIRFVRLRSVREVDAFAADAGRTGAAR